MIQKYFLPGVRLKWTKPRDGQYVRDGGIVASTQAATQLLYDGLDGQLINPSLMTTNITTKGFTMKMPIRYTWLDYAPGGTARLPLGGSDILTGYMSGCLLTTWRDNGVKYVGHVGTITGNTEANRRVKGAFSAAMPKDTTGFEPASVWSASEISKLTAQIRPSPDPKIFGLITSSGRFFSVLMLVIPGTANKEWCVGGVKRVRAMSYTQLKQAMKA